MKKGILIFLIASLILIVNLSPVSSIEINTTIKNGDYTPRNPISIDGNSEFTSANGVTGGSGTYNDPYIIEGWEIIPTFLKSGIYILNTNAYFVIKNCYIHNGGNREGIQFYDVHNGIIDNNIISGNGNAIVLSGQYIACQNNIISNNAIYLNSYSGITFVHSMDFHKNNVITNNYIVNNGRYGIYSIMSYFHKITYNNISSNNIGIYLKVCCGGEYHHIHHNNFINNAENQAYEPFGGYTNYFDDGYPSGGNYWSDYDGGDNFSGPNQNISGSDGFGDAPYTIPYGTNQDRYPFMAPCSLNENIPPTKPFITGPVNIKQGNEYNYTFVATSPNNGDLYYYIHWDDGTYEEWIGPYTSGVEITVSHTWSQIGKYAIKIRAKDANDLLSPWGTLEVILPRNKIATNTLFQRLLDQFPLVGRLLNFLGNNVK